MEYFVEMQKLGLLDDVTLAPSRNELRTAKRKRRKKYANYVKTVRMEAPACIPIRPFKFSSPTSTEHNWYNQVPISTFASPREAKELQEFQFSPPDKI